MGQESRRRLRGRHCRPLTAALGGDQRPLAGVCQDIGDRVTSVRSQASRSLAPTAAAALRRSTSPLKSGVAVSRAPRLPGLDHHSDEPCAIRADTSADQVEPAARLLRLAEDIVVRHYAGVADAVCAERGGKLGAAVAERLVEISECLLGRRSRHLEHGLHLIVVGRVVRTGDH